MKLVFAAMLALLATQASLPSVRVVAAFEIVWRAQNEVRQRAPRKIHRAIRIAPDHRDPHSYISRAASAPEVVRAYQLPPPSSSFAS
jgi:hypothetical protein